MTTHLPPQDPMKPDDALPGEAELSALYRRLPRDEPGPALDAAVLRAAAEAVASQNQQNGMHPQAEASTTPAAARNASSRVATLMRATRPRKAPRWLIGLASAATLVLVAGVAWHMRGMPTSAPTAAADADADAEYRATAPAASIAAPAARESAPVAVLASVVPKQENSSTAAVHAMEAKKLRANTGDAGVVASARHRPPHVVSATALSAQSRTTSVPAPVDEMSSSVPVSVNREAYTSAKATRLQAAQAPAAPAPAPMVENAIAFDANTVASPPAPPAPRPAIVAPAPVLAPVPAIAEVPANTATVAMAAPAREHPIIDTSRSAPTPMPAAAPALSMAQSSTSPVISPVDTLKRPGDTPAQELAKITALFAQHNDAEAQRRLQQFHRDHPTWMLDPTLRARLGEP
jgi:hypothetical protein